MDVCKCSLLQYLWSFFSRTSLEIDSSFLPFFILKSGLRFHLVFSYVHSKVSLVVHLVGIYSSVYAASCIFEIGKFCPDFYSYVEETTD